MSRCQECFNLERFCTCGPSAIDEEAAEWQAKHDAWRLTIEAQGRSRRLNLMDIRAQRIAAAAFN